MLSKGEAPLPTSPDTAASNPTRELAAIMFSDVVGYTAIMGRDAQKGVQAIADHRAQLRALLPRFNGRLIGEIGDARRVPAKRWPPCRPLLTRRGF